MKDPVFPAISAVATLLTLAPLLWHMRSRNWAMLCLILWIAVANFTQFINTALWWSSTSNFAPLWCDISTRLYLMSALGVPCATWCIAMRLERIASTRQVSRGGGFRKKEVCIDLGLCLLLPLIYAALAIVWQGHRFDIYEGMGCYTASYYSWPWLLLSPLPVIAVSLLSLVFSRKLTTEAVMISRDRLTSARSNDGIIGVLRISMNSQC